MPHQQLAKYIRNSASLRSLFEISKIKETLVSWPEWQNFQSKIKATSTIFLFFFKNKVCILSKYSFNSLWYLIFLSKDLRTLELKRLPVWFFELGRKFITLVKCLF